MKANYNCYDLVVGGDTVWNSANDYSLASKMLPKRTKQKATFPPSIIFQTSVWAAPIAVLWFVQQTEAHLNSPGLSISALKQTNSHFKFCIDLLTDSETKARS